MVLTAEEKRAKHAAYQKKYRDKNKEKVAASNKQWREEHPDYNKQWREQHPEEWHRIYTINDWKRLGVIHDDYDALYDNYNSVTQCADCDVVFGKKGDGTGSWKCLDHDHITHAFRAVVCNACNLQRGVVDRKLKLETPELNSLLIALDQKHDVRYAV